MCSCLACPEICRHDSQGRRCLFQAEEAFQQHEDCGDLRSIFRRLGSGRAAKSKDEAAE